MWFYTLAPSGRSYRLLGWLYVIPFLLFIVVQGRSYYLGPACPILLSAGAVVVERWLAARGTTLAGVGRAISWLGLAAALAAGGALSLPIGPVQSTLSNVARTEHDNSLKRSVGLNWSRRWPLSNARHRLGYAPVSDWLAEPGVMVDTSTM